MPEYQLTANVWIRGILEEHYGVPATSVSYYTGGQETPGRSEKLKLHLPPQFRVERIGAGSDAGGDARQRRDRRVLRPAHAVDASTARLVR